jgi:hypothetical protein
MVPSFPLQVEKLAVPLAPGLQTERPAGERSGNLLHTNGTAESSR